MFRPPFASEFNPPKCLTDDVGEADFHKLKLKFQGKLDGPGPSDLVERVEPSARAAASQASPQHQN